MFNLKSLFKQKVQIDWGNLSTEEHQKLREALREAKVPPVGDGKAVFMDDGSHEEFEDLKKEESGLKPWYKRIGL